MRRGSTLFLRAVVILIAVGALALLLWEPQTEGRNAHATVFATYFEDPFLAYVYVATIALFVALYQAFNVLGHVARDTMLSPDAVSRLRAIRHCAMAIIGFVAGGELFILLQNADDPQGGFFIGFLIVFIATVVLTATAV